MGQSQLETEKDLSQEFAEMIIRHQIEADRISELYDRGFDLVEEKGTNVIATPGNPISRWRRAVHQIKGPIMYEVSVELRNQEDKLERYGQYHHMDIRWHSTNKPDPDNRDWVTIASLKVGKRSNDSLNENTDGTVIGGVPFDQQHIMTDFSEKLDLVNRVLSEVFQR
ncbi:MAG: hypothetical protein V1858_02590 [Candidatus Gottesmanbacteria bacterium]